MASMLKQVTTKQMQRRRRRQAAVMRRRQPLQAAPVRRRGGAGVLVSRRIAQPTPRTQIVEALPTFLSQAASGLGARFGASMASLIARLTGFGDYRVSYNSLMPLTPGQPIPSFGDLKEATIVRHREYLADVIEPGGNNGGFTNRVFTIQPALATTFPWLSNLAVNYDQYRMMGAVFEYVSTASPINNAAGGGIGLGSVILATDYDVADPVYGSKLQAENAQFSVSGRPSDSLLHPIECDPACTSVPVQYIRTGAVPAGRDPRLYDMANFQLITFGIPNNANQQTIGELWVSYEVALYKPILEGGLVGGAVVWWHWTLPPATVAAAGGAYFGNPAPLAPNAGSGANPPVLNTAGTVVFPAGSIGTYRMTYTVDGSSTVLTNALGLNFIGTVAVFMFDNLSTSLVRQTAGATATTQFITTTFRVTPAAPVQAVAINVGTLPAVVSGADLIIELVPNGAT